MARVLITGGASGSARRWPRCTPRGATGCSSPTCMPTSPLTSCPPPSGRRGRLPAARRARAGRLGAARLGRGALGRSRPAHQQCRRRGRRSHRDVPLDDWQWIVDINLLGVVDGCRTFVPMFKQRRHGHIVNIASMAGLVHPPGMASYNAVKAGVVALSETLLHELAPLRGRRLGGLRQLLPHRPVSEPARVRPRGWRRPLAADPRRQARRGHDRGAGGRADRQGPFLVLTHAEAAAAYRLKRLAPAAYHRTMKKLARAWPPGRRCG